MDGDEQAVHRSFSARWFNETWTWIDQEQRTPLEEEQMMETAAASLAHWRRREDVTALNLSIGCWQVSRACALAGEASLARRYALRCQEYSRELDAFYQGYACEALARAAAVSGDRAGAKAHLAEAYQLSAGVADPEERQALQDDLDVLASRLG